MRSASAAGRPAPAALHIRRAQLVAPAWPVLLALLSTRQALAEAPVCHAQPGDAPDGEDASLLHTSKLHLIRAAVQASNAASAGPGSAEPPLESSLLATELELLQEATGQLHGEVLEGRAGRPAQGRLAAVDRAVDAAPATPPEESSKEEVPLGWLHKQLIELGHWLQALWRRISSLWHHEPTNGKAAPSMVALSSRYVPSIPPAAVILLAGIVTIFVGCAIACNSILRESREPGGGVGGGPPGLLSRRSLAPQASARCLTPGVGTPLRSSLGLSARNPAPPATHESLPPRQGLTAASLPPAGQVTGGQPPSEVWLRQERKAPPVLAATPLASSANVPSRAWPPPLCPALVLNDKETRLTVPLEALTTASASGGCEFDVAGPLKNPVFRVVVCEVPGGHALGVLVPRLRPDAPWAIVRPLQQDNEALLGTMLPEGARSSGKVMEIAGPDANFYGLLVAQRGGSYWAIHKSMAVLIIEGRKQRFELAACAAGGQPVANAAPRKEEEPGATPQLELQVQPAIDPLLVLASMLSVFLLF